MYKKYEEVSSIFRPCNAMQSYPVTMRMKGLLTNKIKTICYLHFANIIYERMHYMQLYSYVCKIYTEYHYPMYD